MIKVLIPTEADFRKYENQLQVMYEENQEKITDTNSFKFIKDNTLFYAFLSDNKLIGAIYFFVDNNKLFLNAFAIRKNLNENLFCLRLSTSWFNCNIYAEAQNRASALCLLRCGFKRLDSNLFIYEQSSLDQEHDPI